MQYRTPENPTVETDCMPGGPPRRPPQALVQWDRPGLWSRGSDGLVADWNQTVAGPWLAETLAALRRPEVFSRIDPGKFVQGRLRPYQETIGPAGAVPHAGKSHGRDQLRG